jgi:hypothetical protein
MFVELIRSNSCVRFRRGHVARATLPQPAWLLVGAEV